MHIILHIIINYRNLILTRLTEFIHITLVYDTRKDMNSWKVITIICQRIIYRQCGRKRCCVPSTVIFLLHFHLSAEYIHVK